jgi:exonuclease III
VRVSLSPKSINGKDFSFPDLDCAIQNCNSLNVSVSSDKQLKKVAAILAIGAGIIFLSDIRLNADPGSKKSNMFKNSGNNAYNFWHNSTCSKRGVGILISSKLNVTVLKTYKDPDCNILGLLTEIEGTKVLLVSIYGPNSNNVGFFDFLTSIFDENRQVKSICGGDWNLTYSTDVTSSNIDIINMNAPPSVFRSTKLLELVENFHLIDPFRVLYPTRRDFTYVPRARTSNRSRLDFFIVSENLINRIDDCTIKSGLLTNLFDHKCVTLSLFKRKKNPNIHRIDASIFNHPRFDAVLSCTVIETHLQHADPEQAGLDINSGLLAVGNVVGKIREINDIEFEIHFNGSTEIAELEVAGKSADLKEMIENLPDPEELANIQLECDSDIFMEVLMSNVRNALISFQTWIKKVENAKTNYLIKKINRLKVNYDENYLEIGELESKLSEIEEKKLSEKIRQIKLYECLHDEKPSPLYLNLCKNKGKNSLKTIKGDKGETFENDEARLEFIRAHYKKNFKKRENEHQVNYESCINEFLGPEIVNSPLVQNSLLQQDEADLLDVPLRLEELDEALKSANFKSAAGFDGYSNQLIKNCWKFFRRPLLKYFECCLLKGNLTENFRSACIRLIPKKGDNTNLKNWRPISLLSNVYKILSRAINARLERVVNRICSRAQKGYNKKRYTQEVIINIWDTISFCRNKGINGALVAIDMAKAFDSLSHNFLNAVLKFFRFGDNMIKMLELLGNNRQACILGEDDISSKYFQLGCGRAQGDNLSPNTFNFAEQILIFKIELDDSIKSIPRDQIPIVNSDAVFMQESNRETSKNESLADDNSTLMLLDEEGLHGLKNHLDRFATISGLECNYDKTMLMPFLDNLNEESLQILSNCGFKTVDCIELLGVKITKNLSSIDENFERTKQKIISKISFWERFNLSLSGRLAIAKTFMIPLVNYLGCIFSPSDKTLGEIQLLINNFVKKNLRISSERMYMAPYLGGIGMFDLSVFLEAQRVSWIIRAKNFPIDNWRYDLHFLSPAHNILLIRRCDVDRKNFPVLYEIVSAFCKYREEFEKKNLDDAHIFENSNFRLTSTGSVLTKNFFSREAYERNELAIRRLTLKECFNGNVFKNCEQFNNSGVPLSVANWLVLAGSVRNWSALKHNKNFDQTFNLNRFISGIKKGSRKIRELYTEVRNIDVNPRELNVVMTYCRLIDCPVPSAESVGNCLKIWNLNFLPAEIRTFVFNCRFNCLPLNNRLNAYMPDIDARCTFCKILNKTTVQRDGYKHLFFSCDVTRRLLKSVIFNIDLDIDIDSDEFKNLYWFGINDGPNFSPKVWIVFWDLCRYSIYRYKLKKNIPNDAGFLKELCLHLGKTFLAKKNFKKAFDAQRELAWFSRAIG